MSFSFAETVIAADEGRADRWIRKIC